MTTGIDHDNLTLTRGDLDAVRGLLTEQRARRLDVVTTREHLRYEGGNLRVSGAEPAITDEGVTEVNGLYRPTRAFDTGLVTRLGLRGDVARKWREEGRIQLLDYAVNHYLHGSVENPDGSQDNPPYDQKMFLRLFTGDDGGGIARAAVSDKFKPVDNLDVLVATLQGIEAAGVPVQIGRCDITESRMFVQVSAPSVQALAPELLRGYRSPFTGAEADRNPVLFAGFVISNSEIGAGALSVVPRITVLACRNGQTYSKDAIRAIHVGTRREEGIIQYANDTVEKELELARLRTRDAVATFLNTEYVAGKIREMEQRAGVVVDHPEDTIKAVVTEVKIPQALADDVLGKFIRGGQLTAGGVMQAVTAVAQEQDDAELAYELEDKAPAVLAAAARLA